MAPILKDVVERPWSAEPEVFSELSLRGAAGNCLNLLAPILRELSEDQDARWLTLIAPPASLTQTWLREAGLNRERILLLQPVARKALSNWPAKPAPGSQPYSGDLAQSAEHNSRQQLISAARTGDAQSLNIRLG
jgi:cell division inhibitor SulA